MDDYRLNLCLFFYLGTILEAFLILIRNEELFTVVKRIFRAIFFSLIAFGIIRFSITDDLYEFLLFVNIIFIIGFFSDNWKKLLPKINEFVLLTFNILFWYFFLTKIGINTDIKKAFAIITIFPTIGTLFLMFTTIQPNKFWKIFFYLWFLILTTALIAYNFTFSEIKFYFIGNFNKDISYQHNFLNGMVFFNLTTYIFSLCLFFYLIPTKENNQQIMKKQIKERKEIVNKMQRNYSNWQIRPIQALIIMIGEILILAFNYYLKFMPEYLLISILILLPPYFINWLKKN